MDLPKNEVSFVFDCVGEVTGKKYDGDFTVMCVLNMFQKRAYEVEKTRIQSDQANPSMGLMGIGEVLANLRVRIIKSPNWWDDSNGGYDILDENMLVVLYDKVMEQEENWKKLVKEQSQPKDEKLGEKNTGRK